MDSATLNALSKRGLSLLRLRPDEREALTDTRRGSTRFSLTFPHKTARKGKSESLVLIPGIDESADLSVGLIRSVQATSTLDSRVVFDLVRPIRPRSFEELLAGVTVGSLRAATFALKRPGTRFQSVSPKLGQRLIEVIAAEPGNAGVLQRIAAHLARPRRFDNAQALQQDAVDLALRAFGAVEGASSVTLSDRETALGRVRLLEDAIIEHDARWIPGWQLSDSDLTGRAVFQRGNAKLEIFTANKRPLELLLGVDLIYFNERRGALVMVQYKMMEASGRSRSAGQLAQDDEVDWPKTGESDWTVPIDSQFHEELARMSVFDRDLSPEGPYRLNSGAFFFKFVRRNALAKAAGIMLSLGHVNQLIAGDHAKGPRGGLRLGYHNLDGHYLRSDPFVALVQSGYVGTRGATTDHLRALIAAALGGGRAVVAAMQTTISPNSQAEQ